MKNYSKLSLLFLFLGTLNSNLFGSYSPHRKYFQLNQQQVNALKPVILYRAVRTHHHKDSLINRSALTEMILNRDSNLQAMDRILLSTSDNGATFKATAIFAEYECVYAGVAMQPEELENILQQHPAHLPVAQEN